MAFRKFGQGEVIGADETYAKVQAERAAMMRPQREEMSQADRADEDYGDVEHEVPEEPESR